MIILKKSKKEKYLISDHSLWHDENETVVHCDEQEVRLFFKTLVSAMYRRDLLRDTEPIKEILSSFEATMDMFELTEVETECYIAIYLDFEMYCYRIDKMSKFVQEISFNAYSHARETRLNQIADDLVLMKIDDSEFKDLIKDVEVGIETDEDCWTNSIETEEICLLLNKYECEYLDTDELVDE